MKVIVASFMMMLVLMLGGCASSTAISDLALPPVSTIKGKITQLDENGFRLTDNSGSIYVKASLPGNDKLDVSIDEEVTVYGNLQGGQQRIFDGYVIKKSNKETIIINNPSPHFGFIIQTSFK